MPERNGRRLFVVLAAFSDATMLARPASARQKVDLVQLDNRDMITCEVKKLDRNRLEVKTDYMGTVLIEWNHVTRLSSTQFFEFETNGGDKVYGTLQAALSERTITVMAAGDTVVLDHDELVRIAPIDEGFRQRLQGRIDAGLSAKKANQERSYTISAVAAYRTRHRSLGEPLTEPHRLGPGPRHLRRDDPVGGDQGLLLEHQHQCQLRQPPAGGGRDLRLELLDLARLQILSISRVAYGS